MSFNLNDYKKLVDWYIPNVTDMEIYNAINHTRKINTNKHCIQVRGISFTFNSFNMELLDVDYGANTPQGVGEYLYNNKELDKKIEEKGYEYK